MSSFAMTVPYMRTSPLHIPRRDLVLGRADSLFLRVTVVDSDSVCAEALDLSGGIGGPALQMLVWPDQHGRSSWDYGAYWHWPQCPQTVLWSGTGVVSDALGAFDISFPTATMAGWPRRCAYALQLDYDGGGGTDLLAEGRLHLSHSVPRAVCPVIMLTDPSQPVLTDDAGNVILLAGNTLSCPPCPAGPPGPQGPPGSVTGATLPPAQPDGSPPVGAVSGSFYNNGGFVCVTP